MEGGKGPSCAWSKGGLGKCMVGAPHSHEGLKVGKRN
jgi:hypothetical protein